MKRHAIMAALVALPLLALAPEAGADWPRELDVATYADGPSEDAVAALVDDMLAAQDRAAAQGRAAAPARPAGGLHAEIERHVIEPCIDVALGTGIVTPHLVQRYGAASLAEAAKIATAPMVATLTETLRPYLPHGRPEFRAKVYDVFREFCAIEMRRKAAGG